jgi:hypothetical protein
MDHLQRFGLRDAFVGEAKMMGEPENYAPPPKGKTSPQTVSRCFLKCPRCVFGALPD